MVQIVEVLSWKRFELCHCSFKRIILSFQIFPETFSSQSMVIATKAITRSCFLRDDPFLELESSFIVAFAQRFDLSFDLLFRVGRRDG